jgi:hypothetical protein
MAEETQYIANTGIATISTGTSSTTGTGSTLILASPVAAAGGMGTLIKTILIKAIGTGSTSTTRGMIRLFIFDGTNYYLIKEIDVLPIAQASINKTFEAKVILNYRLNPGYKLYASTQNSESFNIIAEGVDWAYYANAVREDTTQFTSNNGVGSVSTANSNLNGTGTLSTIYTAGSSATYKGSRLRTISIKSSVTNTPGMVRLYIYNGTTNFLFSEIKIPSITPDGTDQAFENTIILRNGFDLQAGYLIKASTEVAQNSNIIVEGEDWNYPS